MRRALTLVILLGFLTFGCGLWLDHLQTKTASRYLVGIEEIRQAIKDERMEDARREQAYWHALWQHDSEWLNCLISHHHTRDVSAGLTELATALEMDWQTESLQAVDTTITALQEVANSDRPLWQNIL